MNAKMKLQTETRKNCHINLYSQTEENDANDVSGKRIPQKAKLDPSEPKYFLLTLVRKIAMNPSIASKSNK